MNKLSSWKTIFFLCVFCAVEAISSPAQTFTTLQSFDGTDGQRPEAAFVQATNGNLYGTTLSGGTNNNSLCFFTNVGCGTVFKIAPDGTVTTLYSFCSQSGCADGANPEAALVQATDGNLYGTSSGGGAYGYGTVFKITPAGTLTTLHSFDGADGANPYALIQATDGNLYGTAGGGGANGYGTVFKITPGGTLTTVYSFCSQSGCADGAEPLAGLVQATHGNFYGTTGGGGANGTCTGGCGTVFKITPSGTLTTLHSFDGMDGSLPFAPLVQAANGLYGTTANGAANDSGTVFKITPSGTLTTLYSFCAEGGFCPDGALPAAGLVLATDGNFYGTTPYGGANGDGTIFKITPTGTLTTLYSFCSQRGCPEGDVPEAGLVQDTNGKFYGTAGGGGASGSGTVFNLSVRLGPFVETRPTSGRVGETVIILGNDLTDATLVTFNGAPARFEVVSPSEIEATVPFGATTGKVKVATRCSMLTSNVNFRVP